MLWVLNGSASVNIFKGNGETFMGNNLGPKVTNVVFTVNNSLLL